MMALGAYFEVPAPSFVSITSDPVSPIWPVGSDVTLTCTVELDPAVNVPVTVHTMWTGPNGFMAVDNISQPLMESTGTVLATYTSTTMISSFGRDQSGVYECTATVSSTSLFIDSNSQLGMARLTVGKTIASVFIVKVCARNYYSCAHISLSNRSLSRLQWNFLS